MARAVLSIWIPALMSMTSAGCSQSGSTDRSKDRPTIVSLNPCSDAILAEVADRAQILAISHWSRDPQSSSMVLATARSFPAVSGSAEEVLALRPDIVVADEYVPVATRAAFDELGIDLVQLPIVYNVDEAKTQVRTLASLAGHPTRGELMVRGIDAALEEARPAAGSAPVPAVVWQGGGIVPGKRTLISDLLTRTGFEHLTAERGMRQAEMLSLEKMLADPPRVIFHTGNPRANGDRMMHHPALGALNGTERAALNPSLLWCGGPTIVRAVERLKEVRDRL